MVNLPLRHIILLSRKRANLVDTNGYMALTSEIWIFSTDNRLILFFIAGYIISYITILLKLSVDRFPSVTYFQRPGRHLNKFGRNNITRQDDAYL